tara:strand:+ start:408 stop:992 length:585 start_codon:yes stop_codon:yes gene_type:complete
MNQKKYNSLITAVSILIPLVVALLLFLKWDSDKLVFDLRAPNSEPITLIENLPIAKPLKSLPPIYSSTNAVTALLLVFAYNAIRRKKVKLHESLMKVSIALSLSFLVMYIAYHITTDPTPFGGSGLIKYTYYFILISHILLSIILIPLVLISYVRAFQKAFPSHKKIAKITFPIWLYVTVTGVIVYLMIAPYYS